MLSIPQKGSVDWIDLASATGNPKLEGVTLGVKYVGGRVARAWSMQSLSIGLSNSARLRVLRGQYHIEDAPEIHAPHAMAIATVGDWAGLVESVAEECVDGLRGIDGLSSADDARSFIADLDVGDMIMVFYAIMRMQSPTRREIFTSDPGDSAGG